jgi:glucose-1-phosphate cytidylyltransferase
MKVVILCGGFGTRLQEETTTKPKPMVEIGGRPMLWHLMNIFAAQGFKEFILALGYKGDIIKNYFLHYHHFNNNLSIQLSNGNISVHNEDKLDWIVNLVDTGSQTQTGGRLKRLAPWIGKETFIMTYGDGLANVNIQDLISFHRKHGKLATVTAVRPPARFGGLSLCGESVIKFVEKPEDSEAWVNGGFFVLEPQVLDFIDGDSTHWEFEPLKRLAAEGQLMAYHHKGYWQSMDTLRDVRLLENVWESGNAPWKVWM